MKITNYYSENYHQAKDRFLAAGRKFQAETYSYPVAESFCKGLTIDTLSIGPNGGKVVILSSGIHGVEGYFGSAVQLKVLDSLVTKLPTNTRLVLIHALNPFGFAKNRRFDQQNIDLNRNFLPADDSFEGVSSGYESLRSFLNPDQIDAVWNPFYVRAMLKVARFGFPALRQAVAEGQYEYEKGIFFGGKGPAESQHILLKHSKQWIGEANEVVHLDFHTGLGRFADYKLLLSAEEYDREKDWYRKVFGEDCLEPLKAGTKTAYRIRGLFGSWMQSLFKGRPFRFLGVEFGTYHNLRVLRSIRNENFAFHFLPQDHPFRQKATKELVECFCPASHAWRKSVLERSCKIARQAIYCD